MAVWQRKLDDPDITVRRYYCPECKNYSLHIKHESFSECENGCFITDEKVINNLIDDKKFKGTFSEDELTNNFI